MQLTEKQLEGIQRLYREAKKLGSHGLKREASELGAKALSISNEAAILKIETGNYENKNNFMFTDISVPMPIPANTKTYQLEIGLVEDSPLSQEILAVLKKYHELGCPGTQEEDEIDLSEVQF